LESSAPLPIRTRWQIASDAEIAAANEREGRGVEDAYRSAEEERARIEAVLQAGRWAGHEAYLIRMATHPDERVAGLLLDERGRLASAPDPDGSTWTLGAWLYARAMRDADRDGVLWSPLIDALDARHAWPRNLLNTPPLRFLGEEVRLPVRYPHERLELLRPAFQAASEAELRALGWMRSETFRTHLARTAGGLSRALVEEMFGAPRAWRYLIVNERLPAEARALLFERAGALLATAEAESTEAHDVADLLLVAAHHGVPLPAALVEVALQWVELPSETTSIGHGIARSSVVDALASIPLSADQGERLYQATLRQPSLTGKLRRVLRNPALSVATLRDALARFPRKSGIRLSVAQNRRGASDPEIRSALAGSRVPEVVEALAAAAPPEEFPKQLGRLGRTAPEAAARVLDQASGEQLATLQPKELAALLRSSHAGLRMAAIRALSARAPSAPGFVPEAASVMRRQAPAGRVRPRH
jgi:hypothetical protein